MSLEYCIQFPCVVRRTLAEPRIRELGRIRSISSQVVLASLENDTPPPQEVVRFLEDIAEPVAEVERLAAICRACPAFLEASTDLAIEESIGCLGRIHYPIEATFEHFLANRVQLLLDVVDEGDWPRVLQVVLDGETPFDGERTKTLRAVTTASGLRFFERRQPIALSRRGAHLTTDNLFDVFQGFQTETEDTSYTREIPLVALGDYVDFLDSILERDISEAELRRISRGRTHQEFIRLRLALARADELRVRLLLD